MRPTKRFFLNVFVLFTVVMTCTIDADTTDVFSAHSESLKWYFNRDIPTGSAMEIIGYGADNDVVHAILIAKADVATQIKSTISSSILIAKTRINEHFDSRSNQIQDEQTQIVLVDVKVVRQIYRQGKWYVAVSYENIPDIKRFIQKLYLHGKGIQPESQNRYFSQTIIGKELNQLLKKQIDAKLYWKDNTLYLNHGDVYQRLNPDEYAISDLFISYRSNASKFKIIKKSSNDGIINSYEDCYFKVSSTKKYVSIFAVNPEGNILVLENNIPINLKSEPFQFFRPGDEERSTMFVAVFSNIIEDNSFFRIMQGNEERASYRNGKMKFDKFIEFLNGKDFEAKKMLIK